MSSTGSINSGINTSTQAAAKATGGAAQTSAVDAVADAARKGAAALAAEVGNTAKKALETGKVMAKDEIQGFADMVFHRVQDALQGLQLMPGGLGDKIIDALGMVLSKLPLPSVAKGTNRQNMINADTLRQILKSPDTVSKQIVEDIAALWEHPNVKAITDSLNNPMEAWKKLSKLLGFGEEEKPAAQAASKPAASNSNSSNKTAEAGKAGGGILKNIWTKITGLFGSKDTKESKDKNATGFKAIWQKIPAPIRKYGVPVVGIWAAWHFLVPMVVSIGTIIIGGLGALKLKKSILGGNKAEAPASSGRSFFKPWTWLRSSQKASPMDQAEAAVDQQQQKQKSGGGLLNKFMGHAGKIAQGLQAAQTGNLGAIANMLGGGGAAPNPQNN